MVVKHGKLGTVRPIFRRLGFSKWFSLENFCTKWWASFEWPIFRKANDDDLSVDLRMTTTLRSIYGWPWLVDRSAERLVHTQYNISRILAHLSIWKNTNRRSICKSSGRSFGKTFRSFGESFERSICNTFERSFERSFDKTFGESFNKTFDKTFDGSFDMTFDRSIDKSSSSDFLKMGHSKLTRHLVLNFSGKDRVEKPIRRNNGLTVPNLLCLTTICLMHSVSCNINRKWAQFYFVQNM